ncbi:unnamed protein product [Clavelina lepadiformis]|uniref:Ciliary microtubule inner protein 2B n=1 Tax=Clavelina lepadiformis TaxID=159417 RepID=A0ABP0G0Z1_CLALP
MSPRSFTPEENRSVVSPLRDNERPVWSRNGTLVRRPPIRHYIPKHPFYYSSKELFDSHNKTGATFEEYTNKYVSGTKGGNVRRAFSAPVNRSNSTSAKAPNETNEGNEIPHVSNNAKHISSRPEATAWLSTPVPGIRTIERYDLYRRAALDQKNSKVYHIHSGLLPKYMGYVPGLKFRYGSTFGMLTFNAKEVGVGRSSTWGGAVSLF